MIPPKASVWPAASDQPPDLCAKPWPKGTTGCSNLPAEGPEAASGRWGSPFSRRGCGGLEWDGPRPWWTSRCLPAGPGEGQLWRLSSGTSSPKERPLGSH